MMSEKDEKGCMAQFGLWVLSFMLSAGRALVVMTVWNWHLAVPFGRLTFVQAWILAFIVSMWAYKWSREDQENLPDIMTTNALQAVVLLAMGWVLRLL